jgi:hypothetical protein
MDDRESHSVNRRNITRSLLLVHYAAAVLSETRTVGWVVGRFGRLRNGSDSDCDCRYSFILLHLQKECETDWW